MQRGLMPSLFLAFAFAPDSFASRSLSLFASADSSLSFGNSGLRESTRFVRGRIRFLVSAGFQKRSRSRQCFRSRPARDPDAETAAPAAGEPHSIRCARESSGGRFGARKFAAECRSDPRRGLRGRIHFRIDLFPIGMSAAQSLFGLIELCAQRCEFA